MSFAQALSRGITTVGSFDFDEAITIHFKGELIYARKSRRGHLSDLRT